jgi:hypothetical protein
MSKTLSLCFALLTATLGCCGAIVDPPDVESWTCELCQNEDTLEASLVFIKVICRRRRSNIHEFIEP